MQLYLCLYEIFSIQKCGFLFTLVSLFCTSLVAFWMISVELFGRFVVCCCDGCGCFVCFLHFFPSFLLLFSLLPKPLQPYPDPITVLAPTPSTHPIFCPHHHPLPHPPNSTLRNGDRNGQKTSHNAMLCTGKRWNTTAQQGPTPMPVRTPALCAPPARNALTGTGQELSAACQAPTPWQDRQTARTALLATPAL